MEGRGRSSDVQRLDDLLAQPLHVRAAAVDADRLGRGDDLVVARFVDRSRDVQLELEFAPPGGRDRERPGGFLDPRAHVLYVYRVELIRDLPLSFTLAEAEFTEGPTESSSEFGELLRAEQQEDRDDDQDDDPLEPPRQLSRQIARRNYGQPDTPRLPRKDGVKSFSPIPCGPARRACSAARRRRIPRRRGRASGSRRASSSPRFRPA